MNLNKVFLIGRLTRDPEARSLPATGQQVASFGLATSRFYQDKTGQKQQKTEFHNVVAFGKLAEIVSQYLTKGSLTMIEGRLQTRNWEDSSGQKRNRTEIVAERLQLAPKSVNKVMPAQEQSPPVADANASSSPSLHSEKEDIPVVIEEEEIDVKDIPL